MILVADDDPLVRRLITTTLESVRGFSVVEASDGAQAVRLAARYEPEIVLLDVDMPRMGGLAACSRIRAAEGTRDATIIVLTAARGGTLERAALEAGADRYLTKPFSPLDLMRLVDRIGSASSP